MVLNTSINNYKHDYTLLPQRNTLSNIIFSLKIGDLWKINLVHRRIDHESISALPIMNEGIVSRLKISVVEQLFQQLSN